MMLNWLPGRVPKPEGSHGRGDGKLYTLMSECMGNLPDQTSVTRQAGTILVA